jgi:hypothetical protein
LISGKNQILNIYQVLGNNYSLNPQKIKNSSSQSLKIVPENGKR